MCITQSYIDLILSNRSLACTLCNQVGCFDYRIVLVPGISYTLVGTIRCKSFEGSTSLLVRTRVGCDIITLPLWVHRVGPALCLFTRSYSALTLAVRSSSLLKKLSGVNCPLGSSSRKSPQEEKVSKDAAMRQPIYNNFLVLIIISDFR